MMIFLVACFIIHLVCVLFSFCHVLIKAIVGRGFTFSQSVRWLATDFFTNFTSSYFSNSSISNTGSGLSKKVSSFGAHGSLGRKPSLASLLRWKLLDVAQYFICSSALSGYLRMTGLMAYSPVEKCLRNDK